MTAAFGQSVTLVCAAVGSSVLSMTRVFLLVVLSAAISISPVPVEAQEAPGLSRLLKKIIRGGDTTSKKREREIKSRVKSRSTKSNRVARQTEPKKEIPEKIEDARIILVIGDFLASGLAEGLVKAFEESPGVVVVDETNGSSGLVRDDYHDWNAAAPELIEQHKPYAVVIMVGGNDRQQMKVGLAKEDVRSQAWVEEYSKRANRLAETFNGAGIPIVWTGTVPYSSRKASSDILAFNDIYRNAAEAVQGQFVDVWDAFVDENGNFVTRGPDINGQITRLRSNDGINVSKAGKRLLAFYVEKPLRKVLGNAAATDIAELGPAVFIPAIDEPTVPKVIDRTEPIRLDDPELDGGLVLLGGNAGLDGANGQSLVEKLAGGELAPPPGRADNFSNDQELINGPGGASDTSATTN